ncbi:MAG: hypothetical protein HY796_12040 [Elusimicrobia bacterium]|nr:hypothetical protein [Elusimicrobiota bacterium]
MGRAAKSIGLGVAALAAVAAYFLTGRHGAQNRKRVKGWMLKIKGEVLDNLEDMKHVNEEAYCKLVDGITGRYQRIKKVSRPELKKINKDLKKAWGNISKELH